jgi:hypothetical protein
MSRGAAKWEPLQVGPAAKTLGGMVAAYYDSGGRKHHYAYRNPQRAVACLAFANRLYNGFALVFEDTSMHLTFKRNDRAAVRDWRHFQAIKNEVAGPEREAIELYPPESMLVDAANEYHLWVLPKARGRRLASRCRASPTPARRTTTPSTARPARPATRSDPGSRGFRPGWEPTHDRP